MGRIHKLSDALINQIAAGEVVERPASLVKELVENAVDAAARTVHVRLERGGAALVEVVDDGVGMSRADALLSLERHATSKLVDHAGLFAISTKGFRGEALPSIASVSRFRLVTAEEGAAEGTAITVEGGGDRRLEVVAPVRGTVVRVEDLFFNVPARRKFLKRESTELGHCEEAVTRLALAHHELGFFVTHEGRAVLSAPSATTVAERAVALLGAHVAEHLLAVDERRLGVTISGLLASPELTLPTARGLYTFVNRRYVRDRGVTAAIQRALADVLPPGRQPLAVLFIEVDPSQVDVNVHPQKLEVRFAEPRDVHDAMHAAIAGALATAPWRATARPLTGSDVDAHYADAVERFLARAQTASAFAPGADVALPRAGEATPAPFGTARPTVSEAPPEGYFAGLSVVGPLAGRYWIAEGRGGTLVVIDPRAVAERLALAHLLGAEAEDDAGQGGLFSFTLGAPAHVVARVGELEEGLRRLGIAAEPFGAEAVVIRALPAPLAQLEPDAVGALLPGVVDRLEAADGMTAAARFLAERAAALLRALERCDFTVPQSRRLVLFELPVLELDRRAAPLERGGGVFS